MPLIAYQCCKLVKKFVRSAKDVPTDLRCPVCSKIMKKVLLAPSSSSKVTIDNGFQARAVEVNPDIVEINEARANRDYREE